MTLKNIVILQAAAVLGTCAADLPIREVILFPLLRPEAPGQLAAADASDSSDQNSGGKK